jgi:pyruvate dehydrogenase E2 component (dihydrolipoamide acetyltransferase)
MPEVSLRIPQIGEGLQEARLVAVLKQPGDTVRRDEPIYQMETDKAVMDVESPHAGKLVKWLAEPDTILKIGAEVLVMEVQEGADALQPEAETAPTSAGEFVLKIPQIGEGLQEARLVAVLKQPGDTVRRDEPIYQMETDKAVMDVEAPHSGTIVKWLAEPDTVLKIGADVGVMRVEGLVTAPTTEARPEAFVAGPTVSGQPLSTVSRRRDVPPRTRAYAKSKGLSNDQIESIPATGSKLMPSDVDAFLSGQSPSKPATGGKPFRDREMPAKQRVLMSRLQRGNQLVVPGMMAVVADWGPIESLRAEVKSRGGDFQPSAFTMFAYCVARASKDHPIMRTTLVGDGNLRTYDHLQLGVAVALPGDELVVAVIEDADSLGWREFADQARAKIELARQGKDQATEATTLSITNMAGHGIRDAMAVVVPPGVITIFLGEPYTGLANVPGELRPQRCANIGITIDHRLINGVGGADVLNSIKRNVESIQELARE